MLAGCNGQTAETTTEPAVITPAVETDENIVPANGCPDKTIDLRELTNALRRATTKPRSIATSRFPTGKVPLTKLSAVT